MLFKEEKTGLYTDLYELTMAQGYFFSGKHSDQATFEYFFRNNPFSGGFTVFAGLADILDLLQEFYFSKSDLQYLEGQGFRKEFLAFLADFRFKGNISSVKEGELVFPYEPVVTVEGNILECQLIESMLLNILNFESLIATKAYRIKLAAGDRPFSDFGMRRAQGLAAIHASRAAVIGGAASTSNVLAGKLFKIPVAGTQAHSWIQSFDTELDAFRTYAKIHPENTTLLVDTYDTLKSGVPNAITVAKEMEQQGAKLKAIRLDSGDMAYLSRHARKMMDNAGLQYVKIVASNQLNEYIINTLLKDQNAAIDVFGVGTEMVTGKPDAALDGVYKLVFLNGTPRMKLSENIEKTTLPGKKQLLRYFEAEGQFFRDGILLAIEDPAETSMIYHPFYPEKHTQVSNLHCENLLSEVVKGGQVLQVSRDLRAIHNYLLTRTDCLPAEHKRFISPHIYKVGISPKLMSLRNELSERYNH